MSRPWAISSAVVVHGGTTWIRLKWVNGHRPSALHAAVNSAIGAAASPAALNGTSGSRSRWSRTSSTAQNTPRPAHLADATGASAAISASRGAMTVVGDGADVLEDALLLEDADGRDGRRAGQRVAGVGQPAGVGPVAAKVAAMASEMTTPPSGT